MGKKYKIIYADPPWQYRVYSKKGQGRSAENHYHTMNIKDIMALPVDNISMPKRRNRSNGKMGI